MVKVHVSGYGSFNSVEHRFTPSLHLSGKRLAHTGRFVDFDGGNFLGKTALLKEIETGVRRNRVGLEIDWQGIAEMYTAQGLAPVVVPTPIWYPLVVTKDGKKIGRATSIAWSPTIQKVIGFGHLEKEYCEPDTEVAVEFHVKDKTGLVNARVVELPFIDLRRAK